MSMHDLYALDLYPRTETWISRNDSFSTSVKKDREASSMQTHARPKATECGTRFIHDYSDLHFLIKCL